MKQKSHKLLSLLLALALMLSLAPAALAVDCPDGKHVWADWVTKTEATCKDKGLKTRICTNCNKEEEAEIPVSDKHTWGTPVVTKDPTCTTAGESTKTCTICGKTEKEEIKALGHDYAYSENKDGKTHTVTCKQCDVTARIENHDFGTNGKAAKCTKCGAENPNVFVELNMTTCSLEPGKTATLTATVSSSQSVTWEWTTSKPEVATVEKGVVKAVSRGTTVITATATTADDKKASAICTVTVTDNTPVTDILSTSVSRVSVASGDWSSRITASAVSGYSGYDVRWTTSNNNIRIATSASTNASDYGTSLTAKLSDYVYVRGISTGSATLTAQLYDGRTPVGNEVRIPVTVKAKQINLSSCLFLF